jgi:preprotein translocase subunit SecG
MASGQCGKGTVVTLFAASMWLAHLLNVLVFLTAVFLVLLVLIQRGKGGGLAGAFGGAGGSSPFGSRAGDTFTKVTLIVAAIWAILIIAELKVVQSAAKSGQETSILK